MCQSKQQASVSRINRQRHLLFLLVLFFAACPAYCADHYVSTTGSNSNPGTIDSPFLTIGYAVGHISAGDTIYVRAGTYSYTGSSTAITLGTKSGSSASNRPKLFAYPNERPFVDFSAMTGTGADGLKINGGYWHVKGIDFKGAPRNGLKISGSGAIYNIVEFCSFYENRNSGVQLENAASYNEIRNCDSYYNRDSTDGDADGFAPKMDVGTGNYFYGCRSWQNSDDAYDGYLRGADDVTTTYENCWAFKAGYLKSGAVGNGNGNGFKMGGSDDKTLSHNAILKNCLAFNNKAKGFDQNNNKGSMTLYNCTAFNNGGYNYSIPSALATDKTATVTNCVYLTGSRNLGTFVVQTTNGWMSPFDVTDADFVSIDPASAYGARKADGSLPDIAFMHLVTGSDIIDGGTDVNLPYNGSAPDLGCFEYVPGGSPPGQASNPTPANGATDASVNQDLIWTAGSGTPSHDVYFGTVNPPPLKGNYTAATYDTGTMVAGITHYWRIDEKNAYGTTTGTVWSFATVIPPPPGPATNPTPTNGATDVDFTADLVWTAGSGATSHDVYFGTANPPAFIGNQAGTTYDTGTMSSSTTYYWRIDEINAGGTTTGTVWNFTVHSPPGQATNPSPSNGATEVNATTDLSWTAGSGTTYHDIYFGTTNPPPYLDYRTDPTLDTGTMDSLTTYYWQIDEKNEGGTTTGIVWSFTTRDTVPPTPNPMGFQSLPFATSATSIIMSAVTAADLSGVEYYFANITDPNHDSGWQDDTNYTDTNLMPSTMYTYKVQARDKSVNHNATAFSSTAWTTTLDDTTPPTPNPTAWVVAPTATGNYSITMTATTASDISGVEYYFFNEYEPSHDSGWVASPFWTDTGLARNTTYTYIVVARDKSSNHNEADSSDEAEATTMDYNCPSPPLSDLNNDCEVDSFDFATFADEWENGTQNMADLAQFALDWLSCNRTPAEEWCWQ